MGCGFESQPSRVLSMWRLQDLFESAWVCLSMEDVEARKLTVLSEAQTESLTVRENWRWSLGAAPG